MKINLRSIFSKPTTAQEACVRRDTAKLLALGCLAVAIVLTVLGGLTSVDLFESLGMIAIVAAVVFFYLWFRFKGEVQRLQNIFCDCGERYLFPDHVSYEIKGEQVSSGKDSDGKGATVHTSTFVTLCCKCRKCGKLHTFDSSFITRRVRTTEHGTTVKEFPLPEQLESFFNKCFQKGNRFVPNLPDQNHNPAKSADSISSLRIFEHLRRKQSTPSSDYFSMCNRQTPLPYFFLR